MRVVCINDNWSKFSDRDQLFHVWPNYPKKGEIYNVIGIFNDCYLLEGFPGRTYNSEDFRPVDDTFGPSVCERIEEMIEYETVNR